MKPSGGTIPRALMKGLEMDKVDCLKNIISSITNDDPKDIEGDTVCELLDRIADAIKEGGGSGGSDAPRWWLGDHNYLTGEDAPAGSKDGDFILDTEGDVLIVHTEADTGKLFVVGLDSRGIRKEVSDDDLGQTPSYYNEESAREYPPSYRTVKDRFKHVEQQIVNLNTPIDISNGFTVTLDDAKFTGTCGLTAKKCGANYQFSFNANITAIDAVTGIGKIADITIGNGVTNFQTQYSIMHCYVESAEGVQTYDVQTAGLIHIAGQTNAELRIVLNGLSLEAGQKLVFGAQFNFIA